MSDRQVGSSVTVGFSVSLLFNRQGNLSPYLGNGWAASEATHTWAEGDESWILLPGLRITKDCLLSLALVPHIQPNHLTAQRVAISVNGYDVGAFTLMGNTTIVSVIPGKAVAGKIAICIRLLHPDGARPADFPESGNDDARTLSVGCQELAIEELLLSPDAERLLGEIHAAQRRPPAERTFHVPPPLPPDQAGADAAAILASFQSAGDDCEFGFVQRDAGVEALGLFRFASIPINRLTQGIVRSFADLATAESLEIMQNQRDPNHDYMGRERNYNMLYHTNRFASQIDAATLQSHEIKRLKLLARKFMEDIELGETLFVVKRKFPLLAVEVALLLAALRQRGSAWLLWVGEADAEHPAGSAERLTDGLIAGYVDRIDVPPLANVSAASWISVCRGAHALWKA